MEYFDALRKWENKYYCINGKPVVSAGLTDETSIKNSFGDSVLHHFEIAFKHITGERRDIAFMEETYVYPNKASEYAIQRQNELSKILDDGHSELKKRLKCMRDRFIPSYIRSIRRTIARKALLALPRLSKDKTIIAAGSEKVDLWIGEKGAGKTTLLNKLFLPGIDYFDHRKVIWIRFTVFRKAPSLDFKKGFYLKVIDILHSHYNKKPLEVLSFGVQREIWASKFQVDDIELIKKEDIWREKFESWRKDSNLAEEYATSLIKYANKKRWAFVFIFDNIDQIDKPELTKGVVDFAVTISKSPVRSYVIIVARTDTVSEHFHVCRDTCSNISKEFFVNCPEFRTVINKRLKYIERRANKNKTLTIEHYGPYKICKTEGTIIRVVIEYYLTKAPLRKEKRDLMLSALSNGNLRDAFLMIKDMLNTHVEDPTAFGLRKLFAKMGYDKYKSKYDLIQLKRHMMIWMLMLRGGHSFFNSDRDRTWIDNIYDVNSEEDSYWLKRVILDTFRTFSKQNIRTISYRELVKMFCNDMKIDKDQLNLALARLSDRLNKTPILYKLNDNLDTVYKLTPMGHLLSRYIVNLHIYMALVCQDTWLPLKSSNNRGVNIILHKYNPLVYSDNHRRNEHTREHFIVDHNNVKEFAEFLEVRWVLEANKYNGFTSDRSVFVPCYFPAIYESIKKQASSIARSLSIRDFAP